MLINLALNKKLYQQIPVLNFKIQVANMLAHVCKQSIKPNCLGKNCLNPKKYLSMKMHNNNEKNNNVMLFIVCREYTDIG